MPPISSKSKVTYTLMGLSNFGIFWSSSVGFSEKTLTRRFMKFMLRLMLRMIWGKRRCQQEFLWLGSTMNSSSWSFPKIFSPKPVELIGVVDECRILVWLRMVALLKFGLNDELCFQIQCYIF
jgi:hypothetical protein